MSVKVKMSWQTPTHLHTPVFGKCGILLPLLAINGLELEHSSAAIYGHVVNGVIAKLASAIPLGE